jgi:hypothetical protein
MLCNAEYEDERKFDKKFRGDGENIYKKTLNKTKDIPKNNIDEYLIINKLIT